MANAGEDQTITFPSSYVELNGSLSTDDQGIVAYNWAVDAGSPAYRVCIYYYFLYFVF